VTTLPYNAMTWLKRVGETLRGVADFSPVLEDGETLTVPGVAAYIGTPNDLIHASVAVNTAEREIELDDGQVETVGIGKAIEWLISAGTADTDYTVEISAFTTRQMVRQIQRVRVI